MLILELIQFIITQVNKTLKNVYCIQQYVHVQYKFIRPPVKRISKENVKKKKKTAFINKYYIIIIF